MAIRRSVKHFIRIIALLTIGILMPSLASGQTAPQQQLQIVILAVTHFDDHRWDNAQLQLGIEKRVADLQKFFGDNFPQAMIHVLDSHDQTTHDSIVSFLRGGADGQFHQIANGTVTLFFVLSHGVSSNSSNPNFDHDLTIVTADTNMDNPQAKGLSVAKDLVQEFGALETRGSIVLAFLDTCYSRRGHESEHAYRKRRRGKLRFANDGDGIGTVRCTDVSSHLY